MSERNQDGAAASLNAIYKAQVRPLLNLNEELRQLLEGEDDIHVATIVVAGDQSHGKSSLVEALSGVMLPRGEDMKTKLPLFLQLRALLDESSEEYAEIWLRGKEDDRKRIGLSEVAAEIDALTDEVVGENVCDVAHQEINLMVFRSEQEDLNLIDLPGVVRTVGETGPSDIGDRILALYKEYMAPAEAVLLNVVAAGIDVGTSSALQLSLGLDDQRTRTLVCLTKTDEYSPGFLPLRDRIARDCIRYRLARDDVFCVRNRTPTETGLSHAAASAAESSFFTGEEASVLSEVAGVGRASLTTRLAAIQREKILGGLPVVVRKAEDRLQVLERELLGIPVQLDTPAERHLALTQRLDEALRELARSRTGTADRPSNFVLSTRLRLCEDAASYFRRMLLEDGLVFFVKRLDRQTEPLSAAHCAQLTEKEFQELGVSNPQECTRIRKVASAAQDVYSYGEQVETGYRLCGDFSKSDEGSKLSVRIFPEASCITKEYRSCIDIDADVELDDDDDADAKFNGDNDRSIAPPSPQERKSSDADTCEVGPKAGLHSLTCTAGRDIESVRVSIWLESSPSEQSSCSVFEDLRREFARRVRTELPLGYFLSKSFLGDFRSAYMGFSGHEGLPGSLPPHVAVAFARDLQRRLYDHADDFAEQVLQMSRSFHRRILRHHFECFPNSAPAVEACIRDKFASAEADLRRHLSLSRLLFDQVSHDDHYLASLLERARRKVDEVRGGTREAIGCVMKSDLERMDNMESGVLDEALRLAAYWKAMAKDYSMHVTRLVRQFYLSEQLESALKADMLMRIMEESEFLTALDPGMLARRRLLERRVNNLRKAVAHGRAMIPCT